jgi:hypothetical protein
MTGRDLLLACKSAPKRSSFYLQEGAIKARINSVTAGTIVDDYAVSILWSCLRPEGRAQLLEQSPEPVQQPNPAQLYDSHGRLDVVRPPPNKSSNVACYRKPFFCSSVAPVKGV